MSAWAVRRAFAELSRLSGVLCLATVVFVAVACSGGSETGDTGGVDIVFPEIFPDGDVGDEPDIPPAAEVVDVSDDVPSGEDIGGGDIGLDIQAVDHTPPEVLGHLPLDDADNVPVDGLLIQVVFSEPLKETTVVLHNTFDVTDANGNAISGSLDLTVDDENHGVITFTPTGTLTRGSSYDVEVSPSITDRALNPLQEFTRFRFFTEPQEIPSHHQTVAERYAPTLKQSVDGVQPRYDYLLGFDFDGDFDLSNNLDNVRQAISLSPRVYFAVLETNSHYFINYLFYHAYRDTGSVEHNHGNDLGGAQVVVQRYPDERPVALFVYTKTLGDEDILAFVTEESGINDAPAAAQYIDGVFPQAELFPDGRFVGYLTSGEHQSCSWLDRDNTAPPALCILDPAEVGTMPVVTYAWEDGNVDTVEGEGGWPISSSGDTWGYELEDLIVRLWTRRKEVTPQGAVFAQTYIFQSNSDGLYGTRPGAGTTMPATFVAPEGEAGEFARPPWAWRWRPQLGGYVTLERGTYFLDPAYFVRKRFVGAFEAWEPSGRTGFSMNYCYNPYLLLNFLDASGACTI